MPKNKPAHAREISHAAKPEAAPDPIGFAVKTTREPLFTLYNPPKRMRRGAVKH